ncbi:CW-TYPE ZINC FINGER [Salix purpurea]|uniref:CW-TYPE ZINC FINGER n=1 Tax=Salix purpurea TaxID=77065 RepID=A0A9Q1A9C8_SALPP|nr:CW-TYPE ZINC FINGER [Salix purpurea]
MQADEKVLVDRQKKPANRSDRLEVKNEHCDDPTNSFSACSKNESSMETSKGNHTLFDAGNHPPESKTTKVGKAAVRTGTIFRANLSGAMKELFSQKACKIHEDEMKVPHGKQPSTGKKKPKGSKNDYSSTAGTSNNSMLIRLSAEPKEKIFQKICKGDNALLEDLRKVKVKHTVSIGDRKARGNEFRSCLLGTSVEDETEDNTLEVPEKEPLAFRNKSNVNSGDKKTSFISTSKENLRGDINDVAPLARPLPTEVPTFLIQEDWVCCDKCHKWRLLPYGTNPNQLPQKWLCSMLDWLPGMNHCTFSEEETTDALHALYRLPVAGNHGDQLSHSASAESSITLVNTLHDLDQNPQDPSFSGGKKKLEMKEVSHPAQYSVNKKQLNSTMKNEQVFVERSLHNRSLSSLETKLQKRLGDVQPQKFKSMKEADQEGFKHSKKARMEGMQYAVEDHNTGGTSKKEMGSNNKKHSSCIDVRYLSKDSTSLDVKKHQFQKTMVTEDLEPMGIEGKKRKSKDWMNNQIYPGKKGTQENANMRKRTLAQARVVCKLFGKEKINYSSQSTVDGKNSERRDMSDGLQWMAATSSSSLISSTCKVKINFQDFKDSPVESVCSSPLKISKRVSPRSFSGNHGSTDEKSRDIYRHNDDKVEKKNPGQKVSSFKSLNNSAREDDQFRCEGYDASLRKMDATQSIKWKNSAGRQQSLDCLVFANKNENQCWKSRESNALQVNGSSCDGLGRTPRQLGKDDGQNGAQDVMRRHHLLDASNILASHHLRNDFFSQVANDALEGVKDLKQLADPLQISASGLQIAELFFQAALKFLHGASLFNPDNNSTNSGNMTSAEMYSHAAKLCEYCASEFERCNDLASAFLAHKCIEVAYMRIVYSNDRTASRDRCELQRALQRVCPVKSPSSSTRDHVIPARNQHNFVRLLNFTEDVNLAMEALRKSQASFAAAEIILTETGNTEGVSSIKKVLEMGFHDVEGLLQLVHLAIESLHKTP